MLHWVYLLYRVKAPISSLKVCLGYVTKVDDVTKLLRVWTIPSLTLLPGQLWHELVLSVKVQSMRQTKWTRLHEFKSWTRLIVFHIALIPLGKVWIQLFSLQLWVNSWADLVKQLVKEKENSEFRPVKLRLEIDFVSYPARAEGLGKKRGARGVMVFDVGNGHGDTSSKPGRDWLHFT